MLRLVLPLFVVAAALAGCGQRERRNVVLIVIDTLRQDRLGTYGYGRDTSPNLDAWGERGAVADGLSPTSWTKPAVASILTGLHPLRHNASKRIDRLPPKAKTLTELLQDEGYHTLGLTANAWVSSEWGFDQGFEELVVLTELGLGVAAADKLNGELLPRLPALEPPFFLYVHYIDPHVPYEPPIAWDGSALSEELARWVPMDNDDILPRGFVEREENLVRAASDLYDGEVRFVDRHVGELLEELEELGLMESTVTVIVADHGEEFEDHARMGHGNTLYTEQTRVPLIFHAPGQIPPGTRVGTTSLMDVFPTVLELAGLRRWGAVPYDLDGRSQAAVLAGREEEDHGRDHLLHLDIESGRSLALVRASHKLILGREPFTKSLYDLETDRHEQRDLFAGGEPETLDELTEGLAKEYNALKRRELEQVLVTNLNEGNAAELQALGYLGGRTPGKLAAAFPSRIRPADSFADGLLGWEPSDLDRCAEPARSGQLRSGWHQVEQPRGAPVGRWTHPEASLVLGLPGGREHQLVLEGANFRPLRFQLKIEVNGIGIADHPVEHGPFVLRITLNGLEPKARSAIVRLRTDPPFDPMAAGINDQRIFGVFLHTICIEGRRRVIRPKTRRN